MITSCDIEIVCDIQLAVHWALGRDAKYLQNIDIQHFTRRLDLQQIARLIRTTSRGYLLWASAVHSVLDVAVIPPRSTFAKVRFSRSVNANFGFWRTPSFIIYLTTKHCTFRMIIGYYVTNLILKIELAFLISIMKEFFVLHQDMETQQVQ